MTIDNEPKPVALLVAHNEGDTTGVLYPVYFEQDLNGIASELSEIWDEVHLYRPEGEK